jgi:molybdopterin molybdotransferase
MKLLNVDTIAEVQNKFALHFGEIEKKIETVSIRDALGRYIAEEVAADISMPQFRRSVVDGYAVSAKDTFGVSDSIPVFLNLVGAVDMGAVYHEKLSAGEAIYVPTGGMIPEGADAVVMIEYCEKLDDKTIAVYKPAAPNLGLMNIGDDFRQGDLFFKNGHRLTVKDIGMLAVCGKAEVQVYQKPAIALISTGDELVDVGVKPDMGQIRDINAYTISAFAEAAGAVTSSIQIIKDDFELCKASVLSAMKISDIVIISGGSSAGNKDITADIINEVGNPGVFTHGIAIKPGKPTILGSADGKPMIGLPGHPMSAIIVFKAVIEPFIRKYYFGNAEEKRLVIGRITESIHTGEGRETYQLVSLTTDDIGYKAEPIHAKSGSIAQLMKADGYIRIDSLKEGLNENEQVEIILI